jgi:S-(hydroxymethyl)glutathione dehydrogenase/alcohol dehydrogenase
MGAPYRHHIGNNLTIQTQAFVLDHPNAEPQLETVTVQEPGAREVRVRLTASGVCHTDLNAVRNARFWPMVLGHEGAGIVECVGKDVQQVQIGDPVIISWRAACERCRRCLAGRQDLCEDVKTTAEPRIHRQSGEPLHLILNAGTFCEYVVVPEAAAIPIRAEMPLDKAALVGCGVATGVGAALRTANVQPGATVAIFGVGGVGLNVVQGARLAHASMIIAIDVVQSKLERAREFGATHMVNSSVDDPVQTILDLTKGRGVEYAFEVVGLSRLMDQALQTLARGGELILVGGAEPDDAFCFIPRWFLSKQQVMRGCVYGNCRPALDFPLYVDWYLNGELRLDPLLSRFARIQDLSEIFAEQGPTERVRTLIRFRD